MMNRGGSGVERGGTISVERSNNVMGLPRGVVIWCVMVLID